MKHYFTKSVRQDFSNYIFPVNLVIKRKNRKGNFRKNIIPNTFFRVPGGARQIVFFY